MGTGDQHYCLPLLVPGMLYFFSLLKVIILMPDPYTHTHRYAALWLTTCDTKTSEDERCCPPLWLDFIFARMRLKTAVARSAAPGFPGLTAPFPQSCNHFKPHSHHYAVCVWTKLCGVQSSKEMFLSTCIPLMRITIKLWTLVEIKPADSIIV